MRQREGAARAILGAMQASPYGNVNENPYRPPPPPPPPPPRVSALAAYKAAFGGEAPWPSALLAMALLFVPVLGQLVLAGYQAEVMQRLARRDPNPMPKLEGKDIMPLLQRGLSSFVVEMAFGLVTMVPLFALFIAGVFASRQSPDAFVALQLAFVAIFFIAYIVLAPIKNAMLTRASLTEDLRASFRMRAIFEYAKKTWGTVLVAYVALYAIGIGLYLVGMLACFVGAYLALVFGQIAMAHLRWQIYEAQLARGGEIIAVKPAALPVPAYAPYGYAQPHPQPYPQQQQPPPYPPR